MSSPSPVSSQFGQSTGTVTSLPFSPSPAPTAGNVIVVGVGGSTAPMLSIADNGSTGTDWAPLGNINTGTTQVSAWIKRSTGDETTITVSGTTAGYISLQYLEWSGASATAEAAATGQTASASNPVSFGPTNAPSNPNAVPIVFGVFRKAQSAITLTPSAGWTLGSLTGQSINNDLAAVVYQTTPPNAAVSGTIGYNGTTVTGSAFAWLGFFLDPAGSSSDAAAVTGTLGALGCAVAVSATLAAAVAAGIGPNATAATVGAANAASIAATAGALATDGTGIASQAMAASSGLSLTASLTAAQIQALAASAEFGPISSSLVVEAVGGINTAAVDSTLGALASSATITAHAGVNTAAIAAMLGALSAAGATTAQASIAGAGALALQSGVRFTTSGTAALASAIGPLASSLTLQPGAATLPVDARYFVAAPYRPFYAALAARSFYVMANPNITQRFDTKDPRETVVLTFDASADLDEGETLTGSPSVQVTNAFGTDPAPQSVVSEAQINGAPITANGVTIATGHAVQAIASGGLNQCGYLAAITCTTSNPDKVLTLKGILPVSSS